MMRRYLLSQSEFDASVDGMSRRMSIFAAMFLVVAPLIGVAAISVLGARLIREAPLLWFGAHVDGAVVDQRIERAGSFKNGAPKFKLTIDYEFVAADGAKHAGSTVRSDVRTPPDFRPGDRIGVYYQNGNPQNSVAEHNLMIDVYALVLFLPFLAVFMIGMPAWYFVRWLGWRKRRKLAGGANPSAG